MRRPFYKKSHGCWYVNDPRTGRQIRLDPDEEKAHDLWQQIRDSQSALGPSATYRRLAEEFLELNFEDRPRFKWDAVKIASFAEFIGSKLARQVNKRDIVMWLSEEKPGKKRKNKKGEWVHGKPLRWGATTKRDAYSAVSRVFRWAVEEGHLQRNPIRGVKLEPAGGRTSTFTPAQYSLLLKNVDPEFRLFLVALASGVRPRQVREVTAANVSPCGRKWFFENHKTRSKTGKPLTVWLTPCLQTVTQILVAKHPEGPLFRNSAGRPWKRDVCTRKFTRLREKLSLPKDLCLYSLRHTYATRAMLSGVGIAEVAQLLGHKDTRMVATRYGHLDQHADHLLAAAAKVKLSD